MKSISGLGEDVAAITLDAFGLAVMLQDRVEVAAAAGRVGGLPDAAPLEHQRLLKPLVDRPQRSVVAQVPLAEDAGPIPGRRQHLGQRHLVGMHHRPAQVRVHHAGAIVVPAGEQAGARRRTDGRNIKVLEPDALPGELVEVRRLDLGVAVHAEVAIALVVGDDHHDVGTRVGCRHSRSRSPAQLQRQ